MLAVTDAPLLPAEPAVTAVTALTAAADPPDVTVARKALAPGLTDPNHFALSMLARLSQPVLVDCSRLGA